MASPQYNAPSEPPKIEQIITEFFAKSLHIILEARSPCASSRSYNSGDGSASSTPSSSSTSSIRPRDKWFNLALRECPAAVENLEWWRQSNLEFLVVDVILIRRQRDPAVAPMSPGGCLLRNLSAKEHYPKCWTSGQDEVASELNREKIVERWIVQYERQKCASSDSTTDGMKRSGRSLHSPEMSAAYKRTYKRSIVLMRSLYATVRLLPSYKVFRDLNSTGQIQPFSLTHKISSFSEPLTREEDAEMSQFCFVPVDTPCGRLRLSVSYLPLLEDVFSEPSTPLSPQIITDYVGSPLAHPLKRIQSLPNSGPGSAFIPFSRRHSWSYDQGATPSVSPSPSPTYSDSHAYRNAPILPHSRLNANASPTAQLIRRNCSLPYKNSSSYDEYWPSPPFSPSSSPSPPIRLHTGNASKVLLRAESSPIRIPMARQNSGSYNNLPPTPPKATKPGCSYQPESIRAQVPDMFSSPESMSKKWHVTSGAVQSGLAFSKIHCLNKELKDNAELVRGEMMPSHYSPHVPFSRSSSRLSSLDDCDDPEFTWPFAIEYDDIRTESSAEKVHGNETMESDKMLLMPKSQDAAIGALVQILRRAPPLRQNFNISMCGKWKDGIHANNLESISSISASVLSKSKTAVDALDELRSYREMKDLLLKQGGSKSSVAIHAKECANDSDAELK